MIFGQSFFITVYKKMIRINNINNRDVEMQRKRKMATRKRK